MIQATNIHKYYGDLHVLKGVSLSVNKGEVVSIVGASGAGKTTLLQILGTLDMPTVEQGTSLVINGQDILKLKDKELFRFRNRHWGFIFRFTKFLPKFTPLGTVGIPAFIANRSKDEAEREAKELLNNLGLSYGVYLN